MTIQKIIQAAKEIKESGLFESYFEHLRQSNKEILINQIKFTVNLLQIQNKSTLCLQDAYDTALYFEVRRDIANQIYTAL